MKQKHRVMAGFLIAFAPAALLAQSGNGKASDQSPARKNVWQPDTANREVYREIVSMNIFLPDRAALAARLDRERNPEPRAERPIEPRTEPRPITPTDPDTKLVLVGMSMRGQTCFAFIENRATGKTTRVAVPGEFSQGRITAGDASGLTYTVEEGAEERNILIGQTLTGEQAARGTSIARRGTTSEGGDAPATGAAPGTPPPTSSGPATPGRPTPAAAPGGDNLSELERRLRERRGRGD